LSMNAKILEIKISLEDEGKRLDIFLVEKGLGLSRSRIQNLISQQEVLLNGKPVKSHYKVKKNETISISVPPPIQSEIKPENIHLDILYEDEDLLVVNKPAGMVTHPAAGNYSGTLVNALLFHCKDLSGINGVLRPGIVHRLDKDTSGLLVVAKNDFTHNHLAEQLKQRKLFRQYWALTCGNMPTSEGKIEVPIGRSTKDRKKMVANPPKSKESITLYQVLEDFEISDLLSLKLLTGRTHQIRVHLSYLGKPVLGDETYGGRKKWTNQLKESQKVLAYKILKILFRQALHAKKIGFVHPRTNKYIEIESDLPEDMNKVLKLLRGEKDAFSY
jgi:23S rRNA pseudouridine1911/1915/1917 synthase